MQQEMIRMVQLRELEILKVIMEICDRHGLRYFADGGTCLGAIRHKGFIPWDDDLDLGMPRKDFEKFRAIARQELPPYLELLDFEEAKRTTRLFLKVHDNRTTCIERDLVPYPELHTGVWVDIFPYDGYPGPGLRRAALKVRTTLLQSISWVLRMPDSVAKDFKGKLQFWLFKPLRRFLPFNWVSQRIERLMAKYSLEENPVAVAALTYFFPSKSVLKTENQPFEGLELPCPADYDAYLKAAYGDYMQFPPEEERNSGHIIEYVNLDKSYKDFAKSL